MEIPRPGTEPAAAGTQELSKCPKFKSLGVPLWLVVTTRPVSVRMWVWSLASLSGLKNQRCHELRCRLQTQLSSGVAVAVCSLAAVALIQPLAWELPCALGEALKRPPPPKKNKTPKPRATLMGSKVSFKSPPSQAHPTRLSTHTLGFKSTWPATSTWKCSISQKALIGFLFKCLSK